MVVLCFLCEGCQANQVSGVIPVTCIVGGDQCRSCDDSPRRLNICDCRMDDLRVGGIARVRGRSSCALCRDDRIQVCVSDAMVEDCWSRARITPLSVASCLGMVMLAVIEV